MIQDLIIDGVVPELIEKPIITAGLDTYLGIGLIV